MHHYFSFPDFTVLFFKNGLQISCFSLVEVFAQLSWPSWVQLLSDCGPIRTNYKENFFSGEGLTDCVYSSLKEGQT